MVDITIGAIPPVHNHPGNGDNPRRQSPKRKPVKDRRKKKADRRRSVRSGVVVTLSMFHDRRRAQDRRKSGE